MSNIDERLERLLAITQNNVTQISENRSKVASVEDRLDLLSEESQRRFDSMLTSITEMQIEIRGLQTENRRILDAILNRGNN